MTTDPPDLNAAVGPELAETGTSSGGSSDDIFFAAVKTNRMPMVISDPQLPDNPIIFCNQAFVALSGYREEEIVGRNCRFLQGPETDRAVVARVRDAIAAHTDVAVEMRNHRKDGSAFWNALFVSPVFDAAGEMRYFFASQLDVSRRREAEEELGKARKMEAVGKLTGGIAHDFNNLLQVIQGYADILDARTDPADRTVKRAVDAIAMAANRGATLTQQLLAFARKQELRDQLIDLDALIAGFGPIVESTVGARVTIRREAEPGLWSTRIDPVQAEMALLNILANARDAMEGEGEVAIRLRNVTLPDAAVPAERLTPGEYVCVSIADTGPGIAPESIDTIFDPFFTTKDIGKGTGLGLAMVYGFMRQSGGLVTVGAGKGGGAEFSLYFPRAIDGPAREAAPDAARITGGTAGGSGRVLMVEDQPEVAELGRAVLGDLGYVVTAVSDARAALDELRRDDGYRLVFTDILMPGGMNGVALAQAVGRDHPHVRVLLATGYADQAIDERARAFALIRKPYRRGELEACIRSVLDEA
ncbi:histidine kinase famiy protein [uncultured Sphingomonas sp.]|uniref:histidine kinase famiy protein n=1 Tax=uncultured Sphingomonas sp. TaxID=158754 RepID=UPI0035CAA596